MSQDRLSKVQPKLNCSLDIRPQIQVVGCLIYLDIARDVTYAPFNQRRVDYLLRIKARQKALQNEVILRHKAATLRPFQIRRHSESDICR